MATRGFLIRDQGIRGQRPTRIASSKQSRTVKRKKKKPEWDSTIQDLNVHKATKEEQIKRHELHKSKNSMKEQRSKARSHETSLKTPETSERRKLAILHEVLYGQDKLQEVLSESDRTMSVVRDLFGDDPKKFMGFPNITAAPDNVSQSYGNKSMVGPVPQEPETPTHLSLLSDSVMRTPALNELSQESKDEESSPASVNENEGSAQTLPPQAFESKLDLQRFQRYVAEEGGKYLRQDESQTAAGSTGQVASQTSGEHSLTAPGGCGPNHEVPHGKHDVEAGGQPLSFLSQGSAEILIAGGPTFTRSVVPLASGETNAKNSISVSVPPPQKIEDASEERTSKKGTTKSKNGDKQSSNPSKSGLQSLEEFKKMVEELENEVTRYEYETGRQPTRLSAISGNFTGYTAALITAITKLMAYLKESEIQKRAEMAMREQVLQGFAEQRALVDALTNDILHTQEENLALQHAFIEYKRSTDEQLQYLKRELFAVLKSHEYQALSSSINTLYSLDPVPIKQGDGEKSNPHYDERHTFEYLPGAPQVRGTESQPRDLHGAHANSVQEKMNEPSYIPVATEEGDNPVKIGKHHHDLHDSQLLPGSRQGKMYAYSSQPVGQISVEARSTGQCNIQEPLTHVGSYLRRPEEAVSQFRQHVSGRSDVGHPATGHVLLGSDIHLYPPSQGSSTADLDVHSAPNGHTLSLPQNSIPGMSPMKTHQTAARPVQVSSASPLENLSSYSHNDQHVGSLPEGPLEALKTLSPISSSALVFSGLGQGLLQTTALPKEQGVSFERKTASSKFFADPRLLKGGHLVNTNSALYHPSQGIGTINDANIHDGNTPFSHLQDISDKETMSGRTPAPINVGPMGLVQEPYQVPDLRVTSDDPISTNRAPLVTEAPSHHLHAAIRPSSTNIPLVYTNQVPYLPPSQQLVQVSNEKPSEPSSVSSISNAPVLTYKGQPAQSRGVGPFSRMATGGEIATQKLRERLQNLANRQKSLVVHRNSQDTQSGVTSLAPNSVMPGVTPHQFQATRSPSHVRFQEPVVDNGRTQGPYSPSVSPIPYKKNPDNSKPTSVSPEKRMVVNLPNAWSDISSAVSL